MDALPLAQIKTNAWSAISDDVPLGDAPTMLSVGERKMLLWLSLNWPGDGGVVDAGCFLGGSTIPLAAGSRTVHSYDMFVAPNDGYSLGLIKNDRAPGQSVLDLFEQYTGQKANIVPHCGDFLHSSAPTSPLDILFIDVCKTWELNAKMAADFFPLLAPNHSIVIQQDHNDQSCPWVNITMAALADCFEFLTDEGSSRVFLYKGGFKGLPDIRALALDEKLSLISSGAKASRHPDCAFLCVVSSAQIIFEERGSDAAISFLRAIDGLQPWPGASYAKQAEAVYRHHQTPGSQNQWHERYFSPAA